LAGRCKEALVMPRSAHVEPWLSELELLEWVRAGESRAAYQRRLAVWLTYLRHFPAHEVATLLGVSTPAVWRWHHAQDLVLPDNLRLLFLPAYSPELNPVEHVWEYLRENHFGNDTFPTLEAVAERLATGLRSLGEQPQLVRSLTCFDWLNTIRLSSN
jgi:hypothetical protein